VMIAVGALSLVNGNVPISVPIGEKFTADK
jgi:hypothetical protein